MADAAGAVRRTPNPPRDDHAEIIIPGGQPGAGATNPGSPVSPDAGNSRGDLRAKLAGLIDCALPEDATGIETADIEAAADAILAAGWRPPLPDAPSPWDAYRQAYEEFRGDVPSWKAHFTAHHMHALEAALQVFDPCAAHNETQWGVLDQHGQVHTVGVENEAQACAMRSMTPVRRQVGEWTEVQP